MLIDSQYSTYQYQRTTDPLLGIIQYLTQVSIYLL